MAGFIGMVSFIFYHYSDWGDAVPNTFFEIFALCSFCVIFPA